MAHIVKRAFQVGSLLSLAGFVVYWFSDRFNDPRKRGFDTVHHTYLLLITAGFPVLVVSSAFIILHRLTGRR